MKSQKKSLTPRERREITKNVIVFAVTLILSIAYVIVGHRIATGSISQYDDEDLEVLQGNITQITDRVPYESGENVGMKVKISRGDHKGETVYAILQISEHNLSNLSDAKAGDEVILYTNVDDNVNADWIVAGYERFTSIMWLGIIFIFLILVFGRIKGVNTIVSLGFTCLAVFYVMVPAIINGQNIYAWAIVTCIYIIIMTMLFVNGVTKKSFVAGAGCTAGVLVAGIITLIMNAVMHMSGFSNEESTLIYYLNDEPLDLIALIFAAIVVGAVGAIMDVAMDIASSLNELASTVPDITHSQLIKSGFNIGRDIMGTMANTLVLAYIGSSLSCVILLYAYSSSLLDLFNMEMIATELLQALAGSIGIMLSIPLTTFISAYTYIHAKNKDETETNALTK